jgi:hypothetical protein
MWLNRVQFAKTFRCSEPSPYAGSFRQMGFVLTLKGVTGRNTIYIRRVSFAGRSTECGLILWRSKFTNSTTTERRYYKEQ